MSGKPAARLGDAVACPKCGTTALVQGSSNVFFDGLPAATLGHACSCGAAVSAAVIPNVLINGQPAAVLGSITSHGGVVIGGSGTVIIGTQGSGASTGTVAAEASNPGLNLYLPAGCARKVVHLVAHDEQRRNFALTRAAPQHEEIALPGAHADLGGGYPAEMTERLLLTQPRVSRERYGTDSHAAWSYRQAQLDLAHFQQEPWIDPAHTRLTLETWRHRLPQTRGEQPESEIFAAIRLERQVRGALSLVYLRVMHRLASAYGVPFSPIPGTPDLAIPDELEGIAAKLQAHAQGAPLALDDAEIRLLFGRYVHLCAHWNAVLGSGLGNLETVFVNAPTADGRRIAYPSRPQPGYPQ